MSGSENGICENTFNTLPKLPVPDLKETFETYLEHLVPIVSSEEYNEASKFVEKFINDQQLGPKCQQKLQELFEQKENWSTEYWMLDMYMNINLPLPINSSPGMITERQDFREIHGQIRFASRLMLMVLQEVDLHEKHSLPVDKYKSHGCDFPLCMEQYFRLFKSYRYAGQSQDHLHTFENFSKHFIIAYKNQFFSVDVSCQENLSEDYLINVLFSICKQASVNRVPVPVGVFTTDTRRRWGKIRNVLIQDETNRQSMETIETSLCLICLDDGLPTMFNQNPKIRKYRDESNMVVQMIHGGGSKYNGLNRWYDKTVQFIVSRDGVFGLCYEHSAAEGIVVINMMDRIMKGIKKQSEARTNGCRGRQPSLTNGFQQLKWVIDSDEFDLQLCQSIDHLDRNVQDLEYVVMHFNAFGKDYMRSMKISPDCFVQLALQLTFYKTHTKLVATYESAAVRRFKHGRVDVIRSASKEVYDWVRSVCGPQYFTETQKKELFDKAVTKHTEHMIKVISGYGIDNHMLVLSEIAVADGLPMPEVFTHDAYKTFLNFRLSTSQVTATVLPYLGYGPVVRDGYGASYNLQNNHIIFNISAFNDDEDTCADFFAASLESSLLQMREMLIRSEMDMDQDRHHIIAK